MRRAILIKNPDPNTVVLPGQSSILFVSGLLKRISGDNDPYELVGVAVSLPHILFSYCFGFYAGYVSVGSSACTCKT